MNFNFKFWLSLGVLAIVVGGGAGVWLGLRATPPGQLIDQTKPWADMIHICAYQRVYQSLAEALSESDKACILDLSASGLNSVPPELSRLTNLRILDISDNHVIWNEQLRTQLRVMLPRANIFE